MSTGDMTGRDTMLLYDELVHRIKTSEFPESVRNELLSCTQLLAIMKMRSERGHPQDKSSHNHFLVGENDAAMRTAAELLSDIYLSLGFMSKGLLTVGEEIVSDGGEHGAEKIRRAAEQSHGGTLYFERLDRVFPREDDAFERVISEWYGCTREMYGETVFILSASAEYAEHFFKRNPIIASEFQGYFKF